MRGGSRAGGAFVCVVGLATVALSFCAPGSADADSCANDQLRSGPSERLPDCRAYEQVSPVETGGFDPVSLEPLEPAESSACEAGEACTLAYMNVDGTFAGAQGNVLPNAYLATRATGGWQTTPLSPPTPDAPADGRTRVTYDFSADLSQAVLRVPLQQLTGGAPPGVYNLFLRQAGGEYSLLTTIAPPNPPKSGCAAPYECEDVPIFAGAPADFSHILFEANDSLLPGAPAECEEQHEKHVVENLYEAFEGALRLVGVLPDGSVAACGASPGGGIRATGQHVGELEHAISQDGSRVIFEAAADEGGPDAQQDGKTEVYDRIDGERTIEISAPAPGAQPGDCETLAGECDAEPATFWAASADGSVVYFTSKAALTRQSDTGPEPAPGESTEPPGNDLYRYDVETETLTDLTADSEDADGADVLGVVGASEDGSYVYFVAEGRLAAGAQSGSPNLYVWHGSEGAGTVRFIATLAPPDEVEEEDVEEQLLGHAFAYDSDVLDWSSDPLASQAYVTPDGTHLAFMSVEPLTHYDNVDPVGEEGAPEAAHEVFEYGAETGQLVCVSCDPSGAPPLGSAFIGAELSERTSTPFHQPRSVSDDGARVFFTSPDPLVPGLAGGSDKVFEFEEGGVHLISGAEDGSRAVFLDASASGNDVFFATREQLTPTDDGELMEVYDARVDGGLAAPSSAAPCQDGSCRAPLESAPALSMPLSASFAGPGNLTPAAKPTRKQLLARALAKCGKLKRKRRRTACIDVAKRRYGPTPKSAVRAAPRRLPDGR
ncbi:MAG TPA: hypothetical protein VMD79_00700 [Solirubrobacteraceae bacterium]|nr:hypothetical protein [Solirubrobacteraceae bacterium]